MKKFLLVFFVVIVMSSAAMANELVLLGTSGAEGESGTIKVYGISMSVQPFTAEKHIEGYRNVIIENPHNRTLNDQRVKNAIDMGHFGTHDGKWRGFRVVKLVVE